MSTAGLRRNSAALLVSVSLSVNILASCHTKPTKSLKKANVQIDAKAQEVEDCIRLEDELEKKACFEDLNRYGHPEPDNRRYKVEEFKPKKTN